MKALYDIIKEFGRVIFFFCAMCVYFVAEHILFIIFILLGLATIYILKDFI